MNGLRRSLIVALILFVGACGLADRRARIGYPVELRHMADSAAFPLRVVGFERKKILAYEPGYSHLSTTYLFLSPYARVVAALAYYRKGPASVELHFDKQNARFEKTHPSAVLIGKKIETITKNGQAFRVRVASYEIETTIGDRKIQVFSELMLIETRIGYVKLRSHAPILHRIFAARKNRQLLNAIDWPH